MRTGDERRSSPSWAATSARCSAYVGVQRMIVALLSSRKRRRALLLIPPAGRQNRPRRTADSNAVQKPRNGPNENGKNSRSSERTPTMRKMVYQHSSMADQLSGVSSQRNGLPDVPEV